ncbi:MAG: hypothetical protein P4L85_10760 [Paludisphaera borealis]|uniref:hypothetical protein n=1 Tax=Paludisphaera borealis TaxID=1387353 RepID=UPI002851050C|nr:hypothetical protein [Paludisphaera borealis]MDR3619819.1 hypothetical protein [Paludisphaera borealis]
MGSSIVWIAKPGDANPPDVFLGGPISFFVDLASKDQLESLGSGPDRPFWSTARRSVVGMVEGAPSPTSRTVLADPRVDPLTLAWGLGRLRDDGWPVAYAKLIDLYGRAQTAGWHVGSARAAVVRGDADATIARLDEGAASATDSVVFEEGAAIRRDARRMTAARSFLQFLDERRDASAEKAGIGLSPNAESLAADLLGATLVDAQDELRKAIDEVRKAGSPPGAVPLLTQLPPWPPASVEKLLKRGGEGAATLVETLAGQVAPEPGPRLWLSQSWLRHRKPIDGALLSELAAVDQGRLAREPRFRAWLRAEWTQWARQRYRWVARLAAARSPLLTSIRSSEP